MPGAFLTTDLAGLFSTNEFATTATRAVGGTTFDGIFDNGYRGVNAVTGEMESRDPRILARTSDVSADAIGAQLTITGVAYKITGKEPDDPDAALTWVLLRRAT